VSSEWLFSYSILLDIRFLFLAVLFKGEVVSVGVMIMFEAPLACLSECALVLCVPWQIDWSSF
jgi:hypothetical protein